MTQKNTYLTLRSAKDFEENVETLRELLEQFNIQVTMNENIVMFFWDDEEQHKLKTRNAGRKENLRFSDDDLVKIESMKRKGYTISQIAKMYDMSERTFYRQIKKAKEIW